MIFHIPASNDWPPLYRLFIYDEELCVVCESSDRKFDLNDNLFQTWGSDTQRSTSASRPEAGSG